MKTAPLKEKLVGEKRTKIMARLEAVKQMIESVPEGFLNESQHCPPNLELLSLAGEGIR